MCLFYLLACTFSSVEKPDDLLGALFPLGALLLHSEIWVSQQAVWVCVQAAAQQAGPTLQTIVSTISDLAGAVRTALSPSSAPQAENLQVK